MWQPAGILFAVVVVVNIIIIVNYIIVDVVL